MSLSAGRLDPAASRSKVPHEPDGIVCAAHRWRARRLCCWKRLKEMNLGTIGNSVAGALGGGVGGQILFAILGLSGTVQCQP
jgi:hypothetical protein